MGEQRGFIPPEEIKKIANFENPNNPFLVDPNILNLEKLRKEAQLKRIERIREENERRIRESIKALDTASEDRGDPDDTIPDSLDESYVRPQTG